MGEPVGVDGVGARGGGEGLRGLDGEGGLQIGCHVHIW